MLKAAIKREKSDARINYPEREQDGRSQFAAAANYEF